MFWMLLFGIVVFVMFFLITLLILNLSMSRKKRRRKASAGNKKADDEPDNKTGRNSKLEFTHTKLIGYVTMLGYMIGVITGVVYTYIILKDHPDSAITGLVAYFSFVSAPFIADIGFYHWKSKYEFGMKYPDFKKEDLGE